MQNGKKILHFNQYENSIYDLWKTKIGIYIMFEAGITPAAISNDNSNKFKKMHEHNYSGTNRNMLKQNVRIIFLLPV